jgi:hypothetical protein
MPAQTRATNVEEINNDRSVDYGIILLHNIVGNYDNHCKYSAIHHSTADYDDYDDDNDDNNKENASNESDWHRNGSRKLKAQDDQGKI